jgi:phage N-6-adenine-methyltransferase
MDTKTRELMFSSKSDEWGTPRDLYDELNRVFKFTLDPCSTAANAKCDNFYTLEEDGLSKDWGGNTVFVNPPYTRGAIGKWIKKAHDESKKPNTTVVCLIPSRTDTKYWHEYCMKASHVHFIKGRLKFEGVVDNSAPFPSAIIVFTNTTSANNLGYYMISDKLVTSSVSKKGIRL